MQLPAHRSKKTGKKQSETEKKVADRKRERKRGENSEKEKKKKQTRRGNKFALNNFRNKDEK